MESDCLLLIFQKLGIGDLAVSVRFVCRSWASVSLDPLCWKALNFRDLDFMPWSKFSKNFTERYSLQRRFSFSGFMKLAIHYSKGSAMEIRFPLVFGATTEDLNYATNRQALLKLAHLIRLKVHLSLNSIPNSHIPFKRLFFLIYTVFVRTLVEHY
jgi:hypothetical protein